MSRVDYFQQEQFKGVGVHEKGNPVFSEIYRPSYQTILPKLEFNIVLRSIDVASNTNSPAYSVFPIRMPNFTSKKCRLLIRSIVFDNSQGSNSANIAAGLHIKEFVNLNSYSSLRQGPDDLLCQIQTYNYANSLPDHSGILIDTSQLTNTQLTVYWTNQVGANGIRKQDGTVITTGLVSENWSLDLLLVEL